jgi:hypothetical protein
MLTLKIEQEMYPPNPRKEWDNLGTMVCWDRDYVLGDEQPDHDIGPYLHGMLMDHDLERCDRDGYYTEHWEDFTYDLENDYPEAVAKAWSMLKSKIISFPVFFYDYGSNGCSMSLGSENETPQPAGFIYVTKDKIREEWAVRRISAKVRKIVTDNLRAEVATYNQYLTGDVYGYVIEDDETGDHVDSCWGFFGYDYCKEEGQRAYDHELKLWTFDQLFATFAEVGALVDEERDQIELDAGQVGPM